MDVSMIMPVDRGPSPLPVPTGHRDWHWWPVRPTHGPVTWSARPYGAPAAVITGAGSEESVLAEVAAYERDLDKHIAEARGRLAACEMSNIGRDEARQVELLVTALETLQARLTEKQEVSE